VGATRGCRALEALNFFMADAQAGIGPSKTMARLGVAIILGHGAVTRELKEYAENLQRPGRWRCRPAQVQRSSAD
jgi:hypothetical protein